MAKLGEAFAPANISCVFQIYQHQNPRWKGSYGFGFTLNEGVTVRVCPAEKTEIFFNSRKIHFSAVRQVIHSLTGENIAVSITSSLPLGYGFGLSGASSLATAYAINRVLDLKKSEKELAVIAHIAEVESGTGLGDVVNQYFGGFLLKSEHPSSHFKVIKRSFANTPVFFRYFSKLATEEVIRNARLASQINAAAASILTETNRLVSSERNMEFATFIQLAKKFAQRSGLLTDKKTIACINAIEKNNGHASMIMLGNAVFSDSDFPGATKLYISDKRASLV